MPDPSPTQPSAASLRASKPVSQKTWHTGNDASSLSHTIVPSDAGIHALLDKPSISEMRDKCGEYVTSIVEELLLLDDRHDTEEHLFAGDILRVPWLRTIAKIASREINIFCIPVSEMAGNFLKGELTKIKNSRPQSIKWHGNAKWWLSDASTQISGEERVSRIVSKIIRDETVSHAYDSTPRKKCRKDQRQNDHSVFRQVAEGFEPPSAGEDVIKRNNSNHPVAASSRKVGITATRNVLKAAGFQTYDESISGAARDKEAVGRRQVHDIKDLQHPNPDGKFKTGMVYSFNDQDMYVKSFSPYAGENIVIITPEYNKLAGVGTDSTWYYTIANGEVVVVERVKSVNGATYGLGSNKQRPWDYSANDFIYIEHPGKIAFTTYNVCIQYQKGSHHKWVWLARNSTVNLSKAICDMMRIVADDEPLDGTPLRKADNVKIVRYGQNTQGVKPLDVINDHTYLYGLFGDSGNPTFSIKQAYDLGSDTSMELSENQFKIFNKMGKNNPKGYGVSEVKRVMQMQMIWRPGGLEPLIVDFFGIPIEYRPRPNIMYTGQAGSLDEEVGEVGPATQGAPNIAGDGPGVADTKSDAAHEAYKEKRMKAFSNKIDPILPIKEISGMLLPQFIRLVSAETGIALSSINLVGREVIHQKRTQRLAAARLKRHCELDATEPAPKTNLKCEVAAKASVAPRGITQYTEEKAIQTGRVGLLVKEVLKHCKFYQPGNSPHDIAMSIRHLTEIAMEANNVEEGPRVSGMHDTDYSKMDETISEYIYGWFVEFVLAFVHKSDYEEVKQTLADNVDFKTMLNGKPVKTGFKNNSGSGVTTELNTVIAAFIEYVTTCLAITKVTYRSRRNKELDMSEIYKTTIRTGLKEYASKSSDLTHIFWGDFMFNEKMDVDMYAIPYAVIGPKFGDDGVAPHLPGIPDDDWEAAATFFTEAIGMKLKVAFSCPEDGTFFLGRYYPRPLMTLTSYADVLKACRKISIARNLDVEKYRMKLLGYWTTDSKTPVIREYLIAIARMYNLDLRCYEGIVEINDNGEPMLSKEMAHLLATDKDTFYRVAGGPYCVADEDVPIMLEAIAAQVNFVFEGAGGSSELESWIDSLAMCTTWEELDAFQLPGMDFDPDAEPEGTTRVSGPVANLLATQLPVTTELENVTMDELVAAAQHALDELLEENDETFEGVGANIATSAQA